MLELNALSGATVVVAGARVSGLAAATLLSGLGARVILADGAAKDALDPAAVALIDGGMELRSPDAVDLDGVRLVVTSPGWRPDSPLLTAAAARGIDVWGDVELAWHVDQQELFGPPRTWLAITGTNGKTTTTSMLASILAAAGISGAACGNIGLSVLDALTATPRVDVLAIELSSFQLHWAPSVRPRAGVVLNIAEDHLDWHGGMDAYALAKAQVLSGDVAVVGLDDERAAALATTAIRSIGFRLGEPGPDELGVLDGQIVDRAFVEPGAAGQQLAEASQIHPSGPAGTMDALAAAALARAIGVAPEAIAAGLDAHQVGPHRAALAGEIAGVTYIDDSKATNPHATRASVLAHDRVVWLAGGLLKGAAVDGLVADIAPRLVAAVLFGRDRGQIIEALAQHAPDVPVVEVIAGEDGSVSANSVDAVVHVDNNDQVMAAAVRAGTAFAEVGDTVLMAPAAASMDMFRDYGDRGRSFVAAVRGLADDYSTRTRS